jgi:hypothetical protein
MRALTGGRRVATVLVAAAFVLARGYHSFESDAPDLFLAGVIVIHR